MSETAFVCPNCQAPNPAGAVGEHCRFCGGELSAPAEVPPLLEDESLELVIEDAAPSPPPFETLEEIELLDLPEAVVTPVKSEPPVAPVLRAVRTAPVARVPEVERPVREVPKQLSVRSEGREEQDVARPKIFLALLVLLGVLLAFVLGLSVIIYAVWIGFKSVAKPQAGAPMEQVDPRERAEKPGAGKVEPATKPILPPEEANPNRAAPSQPPNPVAPPKPPVPLPPRIAATVPKAVPNLELAPGPRPGRLPSFVPQQVLAISSTPLESSPKTLLLGEKITDACSGGGGRFYVLAASSSRKILIFDVNRGEVVKTIAVKDANVLIAAGMTHLIAYSPEANALSRYSLLTFEQETEVANPFDGKLVAMTMGAASAGPLMVRSNRVDQPYLSTPINFLDPSTMKPIGYLHYPKRHVYSLQDQMHFRANPSGTVFAAWSTSKTQTLHTFVVSSYRVGEYVGPMPGYSNPTDDSVIVTSVGLFDTYGGKIGGDTHKPEHRIRVPARTGLFYLSCPGSGGAQWNTATTDLSSPTQLFLIGEPDPVVTIPGLALPVGNEAWTRSSFTNDKRIHFVPEAKLIAILPPTNDRLALHRFDPHAAVAESKLDYLYVRSRPPVAEVGKKYTYPILTSSKSGMVAFKILDGPKGLSIDALGRVTWDSPASAAVTVELKSSTGAIRDYKFQIEARDP